MSKPKKHIDHTTSLEEFKNYLEGRLSGKAQHVFEKRMMEDEFEAEALEGFDKIGVEAAERDLAEIQARLAKKSRSKQISYFRIAAVIAFFMSATVALFFLIKPLDVEDLAVAPDGPEKELAETNELMPSAAEPVQDSTPLSYVPQNAPEQVSGLQRTREVNGPTEEETEDALSYNDVDATDEYDLAEVIVVEEGSKMAGDLHLDKIAPAAEQVTELKPIPEVSDLKRATSLEVTPSANPMLTEGRGEMPSRFTYPEAKKDAPHQQEHDNFSVTMAGRTYSKKVASKSKTGAADKEETISAPAPVSSRAASDMSAEKMNNTNAQPINGYEAFYEYLYDNTLQFNLAAEQLPQKVELKIKISKSGSIVEIMFITEMNAANQEKLKAIIFSGPNWSPAYENSKPVEEVVDLKLEFE